jgi:hypothetical protein
MLMCVFPSQLLNQLTDEDKSLLGYDAMLSGRSLPVFLDKHAATIFKVEDGDSSFL